MSIHKYKQEEQVFWRVRVNVRSKTTKSRRFQKQISNLKSEAEARREEKKLIQELTRNIDQLDFQGLNWEDVLHLWWQDVLAGYMGKIKERSAKEYLSAARKWSSKWNGKPAAHVKRPEARELIFRMQQSGIQWATQKKIKNIIHKIYLWGIENRHIVGVNGSPFQGLMIEKGEEKVPEILTLEEIKKFLLAAKMMNNRWYPVWAFAILTGMRSGELYALTWNQIDLAKGSIMVDRSYDSNGKVTGSTKGRYWRTIPINGSLKTLILDLKNSTIQNGDFVLPRMKDWDNGDQAVALRNFLKSLNIRSVKFHALRACFATQMLANGVPAPVVMKIGGWKKTSTMDIYLRLAGIDVKGATDCLTFVPENMKFGDNVVSIFAAES